MIFIKYEIFQVPEIVVVAGVVVLVVTVVIAVIIINLLYFEFLVGMKLVVQASKMHPTMGILPRLLLVHFLLFQE